MQLDKKIILDGIAAWVTKTQAFMKSFDINSQKAELSKLQDTLSKIQANISKTTNKTLLALYQGN